MQFVGLTHRAPRKAPGSRGGGKIGHKQAPGEISRGIFFEKYLVSVVILLYICVVKSKAMKKKIDKIAFRAVLVLVWLGVIAFIVHEINRFN